MKFKALLLTAVLVFSSVSSLALNEMPVIPTYNENKIVYHEDFNDSAINTTSSTTQPYWSFVGSTAHSITRSFETVETGNMAYRILNASSTSAAQTILNLPNTTSGKKYVLEYDFKTEQTNTRKLLAYTHNGTSKSYVVELKADGTFGVGSSTATGVSYEANKWYRLILTYDMTGTLVNNVKVLVKDVAKGSVVLDTTASYAYNQITAVNIFVYNDTVNLNTALWVDNADFYEFVTSEYAENFNDRVLEQDSAKDSYWVTAGASAHSIYRSFISRDGSANDYAYKINNKGDVSAAQTVAAFNNAIENKPYMLQYDFKVSDTTSRKLMPYTENGTSKKFVFELTADGKFHATNGTFTETSYEAEKWYRASIIYDLRGSSATGNNVTIRIRDISASNVVFEAGTCYADTKITGINFFVYPSASLDTTLYLDNFSLGEFYGFDNKDFSPVVDYYTPFQSLQVLDSVYGVKNGQDMLYASTCGTPAVFNAYNLDTLQLEFSGYLEDATAPWTHLIDGNGDVYIASEFSLYKYLTDERVLSRVGTVPGAKACYGLSIDVDGNLYIGTYPNGTIVKYTPSTNTFTSLGSPIAGQTYVRALAHHNGNLYAGTFEASAPSFVKVDLANNNQATTYALPARAADDPFVWINTITPIGNKLFISTGTKLGDSPLLVFDTVTEQFINYTYTLAGDNYFSGLYPSPELNGYVYLCGKKRITKYNLATDTITSTPMFKPSNLFGFRGVGLFTMETDQVDYPGQSVICMNYATGKPIIFNPTTNIISEWTNVSIQPGANVINKMTSVGNNKILASVFMGGSAAVVDLVNSSNSFNFTAGQAESLAVNNNTAYMGIYPNALIYSYDLTANTNYHQVFEVGEYQDRPLGLVATDSYIIAGTMPKYGLLGGAISVHEIAAGTTNTYRNVIQNQTIISLAYHNGIVYGSTSINGGLGSTPTETSAKVFAWDLNTRSLITSFVPSIPGYTDAMPTIGDVKIGPDGLLWAVVRGAIFALDLNTMQIVKSIAFPVPAGGYKSANSITYSLDWDSDGTLYTNAGGNSIRVINTEAMTYTTLTEQTGDIALLNVTVGTDNNIYYTAKPINSIIRKVRVTNDF